MKGLELKPKAKAIVIVAHPDDEIIWMGGTILLHREVDWTVLSLCRASDTDRQPKFFRVAEHIGAKALIADLDDEDKLSLEEARQEAEHLISEMIGQKDYDVCFCHADNGEYGHERHVAVHEALNNLINNGKIRPGAVFYFDYKRNQEGERPLILARHPDSIRVALSEEIFSEKKRIVAEMYGYPYEGIDVGLCTNPESFVPRKK
jgi:LmbE family N-acetylglucosaminyl deacetylase